MKKFIAFLLVFICLGAVCVCAQSTYGFSDEIIKFLNDYNIDLSVFDEVFNGKETEEEIESLKRSIESTIMQTKAYNFNEEQVNAMINSNVNRVLKYRMVEYATIPSCKVTFNGQEVDSTEREYPLLLFRDITYFPMTYDDCRFLGVETTWDEQTKKLTIIKAHVENAEYNAYPYIKNHNKFMYAESIPGVYGEISNCKFNIEVNGKEIVNPEEEYPLLLFRNVTYFPLTWRFAVDEFGWEYSYTEENGLVINSNKKS